MTERGQRAPGGERVLNLGMVMWQGEVGGTWTLILWHHYTRKGIKPILIRADLERGDKMARVKMLHRLLIFQMGACTHI